MEEGKFTTILRARIIDTTLREQRHLMLVGGVLVDTVAAVDGRAEGIAQERELDTARKA